MVVCIFWIFTSLRDGNRPHRIVVLTPSRPLVTANDVGIETKNIRKYWLSEKKREEFDSHVKRTNAVQKITKNMKKRRHCCYLQCFCTVRSRNHCKYHGDWGSGGQKHCNLQCFFKSNVKKHLYLRCFHSHSNIKQRNLRGFWKFWS